eukprot:16432708-Heterocapsa_arctica.AAC.1
MEPHRGLAVISMGLGLTQHVRKARGVVYTKSVGFDYTQPAVVFGVPGGVYQKCWYTPLGWCIPKALCFWRYTTWPAKGSLEITLGSLWGHFEVTLSTLWGNFGVTSSPDPPLISTLDICDIIGEREEHNHNHRTYVTNHNEYSS